MIDFIIFATRFKLNYYYESKIFFKPLYAVGDSIFICSKKYG